MGNLRNRKVNYDIRIQVRISQELKKKALYKSDDMNLSNYIRKLIEKDCEDVEDYFIDEY